MKRDVKISHDLETTQLLIKTDSERGTSVDVNLRFFTSTGLTVGTLSLGFWNRPGFMGDDPPGYSVSGGACGSEGSFFSLPDEVTKVWEISKLPGPKLIIKCNEVTVADFLLDDCDTMSSDWKKEVRQITFTDKDKASDYYAPGNYNPLAILFLLIFYFLVQQSESALNNI